MSVLTMYRGDTPKWKITCRKPADDPTSPNALIDLTGAKVWFTAKNSLNDADVDAVFSKSSPVGGIVIAADQVANKGEATITLANADTATLDATQHTLHYDVQILESGGNLVTAAADLLQILPDSTKATS